ncbi:hypothetical protein [Siminovitchia sp. FSL W7-1587]|uniref:hypothetical protein n=1 Tax=Siminovitchia sp. FSL W7-1587 TaxID=2954699 RepID=UPI0030D180D5
MYDEATFRHTWLITDLKDVTDSILFTPLFFPILLLDTKSPLVSLAYILRMFVSYNITKRMHRFSNVQTGANRNEIKDKK